MFNKQSPMTGNWKEINLQRPSPRFRSVQSFICKISGEIFLLKFIEICMETPCWCPTGWAQAWWQETSRNICPYLFNVEYERIWSYHRMTPSEGEAFRTRNEVLLDASDDRHDREHYRRISLFNFSSWYKTLTLEPHLACHLTSPIFL